MKFIIIIRYTLLILMFIKNIRYTVLIHSVYSCLQQKGRGLLIVYIFFIFVIERLSKVLITGFIL